MARESVFDRVDRLFDEAVRHFKSGKTNAELPEELAGIFERWTMAYQLLKKHNHMGRDFVISTYKVWLFQVHGIDTHKTALEDLYAAPMIGYIIDPINREFHRSIAIARVEKQIARAYSQNKFAEASRLEAVLFKYLDPINDPLPIDPNEEVTNTFRIQPVFKPELAGVSETRSFDLIIKDRAKFTKKAKQKLEIDLTEDAIEVEENEPEGN